MMNKKIPGLSMIALLFLSGPAAQAVETRYEFWAASQFRLTLSPETDPNLAWHDVIPDGFRVYSEHQFFSDTGLNQALLRVGPIWNLLPWLSYSMHLTSAAQPMAGGRFNQEVRLEFEPTFQGKFLPELLPTLHWSNRHRMEFRNRSDRRFWRYRNRLTLDYGFADTPLTSFIANEVHFELNQTGFNQNRFLLGLNWKVNQSTQLSLSYLNRQILSGGEWGPEHGLILTLGYNSQEDGIFQMQSD